MNELNVIVRKIVEETSDIKSFELGLANGGDLPTYTAGSHIDVHVAPGLVRQYSLCGQPRRRDSYLIAVKKEVQSRGGSRALHDDIKVGSVLKISRPRNHFKIAPGGKTHLLLGGGIGVTPILAMAYQLLEEKKDFHIEYFSRTPEETAFYALLQQPEFAGKVRFNMGMGGEEVGRYLTDLLHIHPDGGQLYLCGPKPFMDAVVSTAHKTWPADAVHLEYFAADPQALSGEKDAFTIRLARSGGEYVVNASQSIVETLEANGVLIECSCEQGVCGTCLTGVLEGEIDHRDLFLSEREKQEGNKIMPCVSRAKGDHLVLDL